jgi:hypothetical protein
VPQGVLIEIKVDYTYKEALRSEAILMRCLREELYGKGKSKSALEESQRRQKIRLQSLFTEIHY